MAFSGTTIIDTGETPPLDLGYVFVQWRAKWTDSWSSEPELRFMGGSHLAAGDGLSTCRIERRYGTTKQPWETAMTSRLPWSLFGLWIRVGLFFGGASYELFVGRITNQAADLLDIGDPKDSSREVSGIQTWVAHGPLRILQKIHVSRSFWLQSDDEKELGWIPDLNARDERRTLIGNRSATKSGGTYLFGGTDEWSHFDAVEYILKRFVEQATGPKWRIGGATDALSTLKEHIEFGSTQTVAEILSLFIPNRLGLDYLIQPYTSDSESGFEIYVYALTAQDWGFNGAVLPKNPFEVRMEGPLPFFIDRVQVTFSGDQQYSKIRVLGSRAITCCSLRVAQPDETLEKKWSDELEQAYKDGTGSDADDATLHDAARLRDKSRPVYQQFGAPQFWSFNNGTAAPKLDLSGDISKDDDGNNEVADFQTDVRRTLNWLPLREGFDYSVDPAIDNNLATYQPDLLPPAAWLFGEFVHQGIHQKYILAEEGDIGVSVSGSDWGVFLQASPNHDLAKGTWTGARPSNHFPFWDWRKLVVTIAIEMDQRLLVGFDVPPLPGFDSDGSYIDIEVPDAEFWYLAPDTVVGINDDGTLKTSPTDGVVLRNDADRLAIVAAGALARYVNTRQRTVISMRGIHPWADLVGRILTVVHSGDEVVSIQSAITSIEWVSGGGGGDDWRTIIRTGFAQ